MHRQYQELQSILYLELQSILYLELQSIHYQELQSILYQELQSILYLAPYLALGVAQREAGTSSARVAASRSV